MHTRFFSDEGNAQHQFDEMKLAIEDISALIPYKDDSELQRKRAAAIEAISAFMERFP